MQTPQSAISAMLSRSMSAALSTRSIIGIQGTHTIMSSSIVRRLTFAKFGLLDVMLVVSKLLGTISSLADSECVRVDVGGGSVLNETRNSLARISLRWMIQECFRTNTGIQFRPDALEALGLHLGTQHHAQDNPSQQLLVPGDMGAPGDPSTINGSAMPAEASAFTTKEEEERADALSPMHDELDNVKAWWILECLPLRHRRQYEGMGTPRHYWSYVSSQTSWSYAE